MRDSTIEAVYRRDGVACRICREKTGLDLHHLVAKSQGGGDRFWNLIPVCRSCHGYVHAYRFADDTPGADSLVLLRRLKNATPRTAPALAAKYHGRRSLSPFDLFRADYLEKVAGMRPRRTKAAA